MAEAIRLVGLVALAIWLLAALLVGLKPDYGRAVGPWDGFFGVFKVIAVVPFLVICLIIYAPFAGLSGLWKWARKAAKHKGGE